MSGLKLRRLLDMLDLVCVLLASLMAGVQPPAAAGAQMRDQFGETASVSGLHSEEAVVMVVTARRLRTVKPWERAIQERYEGLASVLVADVPDDSPAEYDRVAAKLLQRVPEGVRVLIDMDRAWARELDLDTSKPNLLLLDGDGSVVASVAGRWDPELAETLFIAIDRLRGAR